MTKSKLALVRFKNSFFIQGPLTGMPIYILLTAKGIEKLYCFNIDLFETVAIAKVNGTWYAVPP